MGERSGPFASVPRGQWDDWRWQLANRLTDLETVSRVVNLTPDEAAGARQVLGRLRMAITPYYASLMDPDDPACPIRRQAIPTAHELTLSPGETADPLAEDEDAPAPGVTHRYPDRVLLLVTDQCSMYCRHCTRRRWTGVHDSPRSEAELAEAMAYIEGHPAIRDVLISGGDPFTLGDDRLEAILKRLKAIPHVEIVRLGTRAPVVFPQRITPALCQMLRRYHPLYVNTHFNHPRELTAEAAAACALLADAGIPLGNQSVLLRGVNDDLQIMRRLVTGLLKLRVRPYYIYQCDLSYGLGHFRTPVARGIELIEGLRGHISGLAVPTFVVDAPGGGGKIPVMPHYLIAQGEGRVILRNFEGVICAYDDPPAVARPRQMSDAPVGVAGLLAGAALALEPEALPRKRRRRQ